MKIIGHPLAGILWERQFEKVLLQYGWEKVSKLGMLIRLNEEKTILVCVCVRYKTGWKETQK